MISVLLFLVLCLVWPRCNGFRTFWTKPRIMRLKESSHVHNEVVDTKIDLLKNVLAPMQCVDFDHCILTGKKLTKIQQIQKLLGHLRVESQLSEPHQNGNLELFLLTLKDTRILLEATTKVLLTQLASILPAPELTSQESEKLVSVLKSDSRHNISGDSFYATIKENDHFYSIQMDVGKSLAPEDIILSVDELKNLSVKTPRLERNFVPPQNVNLCQVEGSLCQGVLLVTMPKTTAGGVLKCPQTFCVKRVYHPQTK